MAYIALLNNFCELILNFIDVGDYFIGRFTITVWKPGWHLFLDFRTHYLAIYCKQSSIPLNRDYKCEIIGLIQVIREHLSTFTHPFLFQLQVKLLMNEACAITFSLILQNFGVIRNASRMDSIEEVYEDLGSVSLLVQYELVHQVKPLKKCFSQVISVIPWSWIRPLSISSVVYNSFEEFL